jgi:hypothetical protein
VVAYMLSAPLAVVAGACVSAVGNMQLCSWWCPVCGMEVGWRSAWARPSQHTAGLLCSVRHGKYSVVQSHTPSMCVCVSPCRSVVEQHPGQTLSAGLCSAFCAFLYQT